MIAPIQAELHKHFSADDSDPSPPRSEDPPVYDDVDDRDLVFIKMTSEVVKMNEKVIY